MNMGTIQVQDMQKRFDFRANGMEYDLRLVSTTEKEWEKWQDELLKLATSVINEMCRYQPQFTLKVRPQIFTDTERTNTEMYFRFCSDVGRVEVVFDYEPKTLNITYKRMEPTMYEELYSLF